MSCLIAERFLELKSCQDARTVYLYAGYGSEVSTENLCRKLLAAGKRVAMPRVMEDEIHMEFYEISGYNKLTKGYRGILEPEMDCPLAKAPDILVMPGAAFDRKCGRIGYGKGFYDRYLAHIPHVFTAAFAFECQIVGEIPTEPHDYRPDIVITEKKIWGQHGGHY